MGTESKQVFEGRLCGLPEEELTDVCIFISSTFTDMAIERNYILNDIIPEVRQCCLQRGLSFQVIDMRWGVRDDASIDHTTTEIVLKEVKQCKKHSKGPFFVVFLGDKYGSRMLPHYIEATEFKLLRRIAMKLGHDIPLLDQWFARDDNAEPSVYVLRSITDILTHYDDDSPEHSKQRDKERKEWDEISNKLLKMFRAAADYAYDEKMITKEGRHVYFKSVTESEVEEGILIPPEVKDKVIVYERTFHNIDLSDDKAWRFIDLKDGAIDKEVEELRERLKITKVEPKVGPTELQKYNVEWRPGGIDTEYVPHQEYLNNLCQDFKSKMMRMIDAAITKAKQTKSLHNFLYKEILFHLKFCERKSEIFCGREELLEDIKQRFSLTFQWKDISGIEKQDESSETRDAMQDLDTKELDEYTQELQHTQQRLKQQGIKFCNGDPDHDSDTDPKRNTREEDIKLPPINSFSCPVVIYGESGTGKTSIMAKLAYKVREWYPQCVTIVRFLGTTIFSTSIRSTLVSICHHICYAYGILQKPTHDLEADFLYLCKYFTALLWKIETKERPLVLIFDSVDQLSASDNSHSMIWIPSQLPENVHMIVSMIPKVKNCLENALQHLPNSDMYIEIPLLTTTMAEDIIKETCKKFKRRLNRQQNNFLVEKFSVSPNPLYLKLLLDKALTWRSYTSISNIRIGETIKAAIFQFFDQLEASHGIILIQKLMAAISASRDGISKSELEDVLSLDDEVLQDTYLYHLPPNSESIRLPLSIMSLFMEDVKEYITLRTIGPNKIISWYHRYFVEACQERYFPKNKRKDTHLQLALYFEGYWYGKTKPLELYKIKKGSYPNAKRNVQPQPIKFKEHMYNFRKLMEYPYHLIMSGQFEKFIQNCVCDFEFLHAQISVTSVTQVMEEMKLALSTMDEYNDLGSCYKDIEAILQILRLDADFIRKDANLLAPQIIAHFGPKYSPGSKHIEKLVKDAIQWTKDCDVALLVPDILCAPAPGEILKGGFTAQLHIKGASYKCNYGSVMCFHEPQKCSPEIQNNILVISKSDSKHSETCLLSYNLADEGRCQASKDIEKTYNAVFTYCNNKYIHLVNDGKNKEELFDSFSSEAITFPYPQDCITMTNSGSLLAFSSVSKIYVCRIGKSIHFLTTIQTLTVEDSPVKFLAISPDEKLLVSIVGKSEYIFVFDILTGLQLNMFDTKQKFLNETPKSLFKQTTTITKDNKLIIKEGKDMALIDLTTGKKTTLRCCTYYTMNVVSVHPSEKFVAVGTNDSVITTATVSDGKPWRVWNVQNGEIVSNASSKYLNTNFGVSVLKLFGMEYLFAAITQWRSSEILLTYIGTMDSPISEAVPYLCLQGHSDGIVQMMLKSDESLLITAAEDNMIMLWDLPLMTFQFMEKYGKTPSGAAVLGDFEESVKKTSNTTQFAISHNDEKVYIATDNGQLLIHGIDDCDSHELQVEEEGKVNFVLASKSGEFIITAPAKQNTIHIKIWNSKTYDLVHELKHRCSSLTCIAESNNVLVAGTAGMEAKGCIWNIQTGQVLKSFELLYSLYEVAINSTGTMILSTLFEYPIFVSATKENIDADFNPGNIDSQTSGVSCLDISPNDHFALSGSTDGVIRVLETPNKYLYHFKQNSSVIAARFTPDSQYVVSTGYKSIYVWNMNNGELRFKLKNHNGFVTNVQFDRAGKYMITSGRDKKIVYWDVRTFISLASYYVHCEVDRIGLTSTGDKVIYIPKNVGHVAILSPNNKMCQLKKQDRVTLRKSLLNAQAVALSFSSQKTIERQTSSACSIL